MNRSDEDRSTATAYRIFSEYGDYIYSILRFRVKNEALCEDLYQELFLKLLQDPIPEDNDETIKSCLYRRITCLAIDAHRRESCYKSHVQKSVEPVGDKLFEQDSADRMALREDMERLFDLIENKLEKHQAKVILARHKEDRNIQETAQALGIKERSVSRYYTSGMKRLKALVMAQKRV